jgi:hypothetical protein
MDATLTTAPRPRSTINAPNACVHKNAPSRFVPSTVRHSSNEV